MFNSRASHHSIEQRFQRLNRKWHPESYKSYLCPSYFSLNPSRSILRPIISRIISNWPMRSSVDLSEPMISVPGINLQVTCLDTRRETYLSIINFNSRLINALGSEWRLIYIFSSLERLCPHFQCLTLSEIVADSRDRSVTDTKYCWLVLWQTEMLLIGFVTDRTLRLLLRSGRIVNVISCKTLPKYFWMV